MSICLLVSRFPIIKDLRIILCYKLILNRSYGSILLVETIESLLERTATVAFSYFNNQFGP